MKKNEFLKLVESVLDLDEGSLKGDETLEEISEWDSLATVLFISEIDDEFDLVLEPEQVDSAKTLDDLLVLVNA